MENLIIALNCVMPIFIYMLVGYYAKSRKVVSQEVFSNISRLAFFCLLPFTMFHNIYTADLSASFSVRMMVYLVTVNILVFVIGCAVMFRTVKNGRRRGLYLQNLYRSNIAVVGVSLAQPLMTAGELAAMCVAIAVLVPISNAMAIIALELCRGTHISPKKLVMSVAKNPLVFGSLTGIVFSLLGLRLPSTVETAIAGLAKTGSVIILVALGGTFTFTALRKNAKILTLLTAARLVILPAVMITPAIIMGIRGSDLATILICFAAPLATAVYSMALVYDSDDELTGQLVVTTSLFCCVTLFLWIFLFKQLGLF